MFAGVKGTDRVRVGVNPCLLPPPKNVYPFNAKYLHVPNKCGVATFRGG